MAKQHLERNDNWSSSHHSPAQEMFYSDSPSTHSFEHDDVSARGLEGGSLSSKTLKSEKTNGKGKKRWWSSMAVRGRHGFKDEGDVFQLSDPSWNGIPKRKSSRHHFCVSGGISGLTILFILLTANLLLAFTTLLWNSNFDDTLLNWGVSSSDTTSLAWHPTDFTRDIQPIPCHSHNDYWRRVPLFSALRHGFISVEADVWLFDGHEELYVGHNRASLTRNRTFTSLYIDPLVQILQRQNPTTEFYTQSTNGVFDVDPSQTLALLVDIKTSGPETWPAVLAQLQPLRERGWLSFAADGKVHTRPVTVVGTGNTPFDLVTQNETYRDVFFDAPLDTMGEPLADAEPWAASSPPDATAPPPQSQNQSLNPPRAPPRDPYTPLNSYYASASFSLAVGRLEQGRLTPAQIERIRAQVRGAQRRGLKARYWETPVWPRSLREHVWSVLVREGVDVLNVDDLKAAASGLW